MHARTAAGLLVVACAGCSLLTSTDGLSDGPAADAGSSADGADEDHGGDGGDGGDGSTPGGDGSSDAPSLLEAGSDSGTKVVLVAAGGKDLTGLRLDSVAIAPLQGAALGTWTSMTKLPLAESLFTRVVGYGGRVFVFFNDSVISAEIAVPGTALWSAQPPYPRTRGGHCVAAAGDTAYVIGGNPGGQATVAVDKANLSKPLLTWSATASLPALATGTGGRKLLGCAANAEFVYVVAGKDSNGVHQDEVVVARRDASGELGAWTTTTKLPSAAYWPVVTATASHVYVVGGSYDTLDPRTVLIAAIQPDGSLGLWQLTTQLPVPIDLPGVVATAGRVLVTGGGGGNPSLATSEVFSATIDPTGALGGWVAATAMPIGRSDHGLAFALVP